MALLLSIFQVLYVLGFFIGASILFDYDLTYVHCTPVTARSAYMSLTVLSILFIQLFALTEFRRLLRRNTQFLQKHNESLSERYQIKENIRTLKLLLPLVETQFALNFIPILMWLTYAFTSNSYDSRDYPIFEESINRAYLWISHAVPDNSKRS
ncbi:hypothetical protein PMAYCL1PPCAC_21344, partial [Pristionchus mayeri]